MFSQEDNNLGVVRTTWQKISEKVNKADAEFAALVNKLSPGSDYPVYLLYLPYGMLKGDTESSYLPSPDGGFLKLSDESLPIEIKNELGYGMSTSPLGMILENEIEYFIEIDGEVIPYDVAGPGRIFNKSIILNKKLSRNYSPNGVLKASAGSRTSFLLPSINSHNNIIKLSNSLKSKIVSPKKISDHWNVFKKIALSETIESNWKVCLLYFSEKWIQSLAQDSEWRDLKAYISESDRILHQYDSNNIFYEIFYSYVQRNHNLKITNPYITNTAIHLIKIALGEMPGYIPATDEHLLPLHNIQHAFCHYYDIEHHPTVMVPHIFKFETDKNPIYYSLQHPTMPSFSIKRNNRVSANDEIKAIDYILPSFLESMRYDSSMLNKTVFSELAQRINFTFFHNVPCGNDKINGSETLQEIDPRFAYSFSESNKKFCHEGKFLRGCIQIATN
ncbi:TPA: hypothetical protein JAN90_12015 [Legionella pneumophila]|nr:hypothetical protein [Legionella pneumophila]HAT9471188.1 hypothetical protein [Legionella pneumophila subsp. pneumophila]